MIPIKLQIAIAMLFLLAAPEPEPAPEPTSAAVQVQAAVRNLPPTQRIIPHLVYDHDCSLREIGRKQLAGLGWRRRAVTT
jgi:DNA-directed RNA polymerase specialized sigma24 family protein